MSRTDRYVPLMRAETTMLRGGAARLARRRADLEEQIAVAFAAGDRERVSELRAVLATVVSDPGEADA